ncbi:OFA family MFS transporter [Candidatus Deferrimicrobium sp.]|uniref:L-lactate MFS transporter n=1 Tax=Candidatus Deferrimicrobium sp. TaxID=3060586 RepID=UPI0027280979|nr:OFA family MFS transporter [Candidatus Deferrimicrobium sp.]MDO8738132.1 OFA family MFS transporter [Candidatus Deferrimicrobium sp.]
MADEKLTNRWLMVAAALVLQLCLGVLYAWSVFRAPLMKQFGWTVKEAGYPLMASFFFFAVGMIVAGRWQDKAGPRKVAIFGGVLLAVGCFLAGAIGQTVGGMVFAYGILGGLGVGFAYVTPIATCIKWFPDMRGTITGLAVFGFGAGTLVFGPLINKLITSMGLASTFYVVGAIMLVCVCGAGSFFKAPPAGYKPAGWNPPTPSASTATKADWAPNEIIGNGQFYVLWLIYLIAAAAGLMIIGQAVPIGLEVAKLDKAVAAAGLGTMALLNGLGRLVHGSISDKLGRKNTLILCFAEYLVAFLLLLPNADTFTKWLVGICIVGFSYGGYLAIMPSMTADYFGTKSLGANYGYLFTAWGIAGVGGPFMIDAVKTATGSFTYAMYYISAACVAGIVLVFVSKKPEFKGA